MEKEFIPTLGNLIKQCDATLEGIPKSCYPLYAKCFKDTMIEKVIFSGENFEEQASIYCEESGWQRPK